MSIGRGAPKPAPDCKPRPKGIPIADNQKQELIKMISEMDIIKYEIINHLKEIDPKGGGWKRYKAAGIFTMIITVLKKG